MRITKNLWRSNESFGMQTTKTISIEKLVIEDCIITTPDRQNHLNSRLLKMYEYTPFKFSQIILF